MKKYLYILLILIGSANSLAQGVSDKRESVKVIASVEEGKIMLRWAVTSASVWMKANDYGYIIERYTIHRDGIRLEKPELTILNPEPLKPSPLYNWEQLVQENDYAAILAQALYGESFNTDEAQGDLLKIVNKAEEIQQRFSFGLFAADMSFEAALLGGLGFIDKSIKSNESYYYIVKTAIPEEIAKVLEGSIYVKPSKPTELPKPLELIAVPQDKSIMLTWNYHLFKEIYTAYFVERSENGVNFERLGNKPFINFHEREEDPLRVFYVDTIAQNNKEYYYRVVGLSPFGKESVPSDIVSASGVKKLEDTPHIDTYELKNNEEVLIKWSFPKETEDQITAYNLNRSSNHKGPFRVVKSGISPHLRETTIKVNAPSNYFTITAVGKGNDDKATSLPVFIQKVDSIPPLAPVELSAQIDSLGVVQISWKENIESDMLGYRVFRGNLENEEFSQITESPISQNAFTDTVQVASLNKQVFYKVVAVDTRYNMSDYSEVLLVKKPDVVPPSSPVFSSYDVSSSGVFVKWINSSSEDVKSHQLFRQNVAQSEKGWQLIFKTDTVTTFIDKKVQASEKYRYAIFAEDDSGLRSVPSTPISVTYRNFETKDAIKGVDALVDKNSNTIELFWRKPSEEVVEVLIYKSKKDEKPVLWRQVPVQVNRLVDESISPNNVYVYQLKAVMRHGGYSNLKVKEIMY